MATTEKISRQYVIRDPSLDAADANFSSLVLESKSIPAVGENEVLVRIHAVSLNWRDAMIATNNYLSPVSGGFVPCSDGAGEVVEVGPKVSRFKPGDRVAAIFLQTHISGLRQVEHAESALGGKVDGMLREYGVFNENGLVAIPNHLSWEEASTLPCAGVTAWNALMGSGRQLVAGDTVLTQGTGGVSMFAVQFALAAGAEVISTTSSATKADKLEQMGVHHVINYRTTPEWGSEAKRLSNEGRGADWVIEIGGPDTLEQSFKAVKSEGVITVIGRRTGQGAQKNVKVFDMADAFAYVCSVRRIQVGSRQHFEDMNRSIAVNKIRPVVDPKVFRFEEAPQAYRYLWEQKQIGNIVIKIDH